MQAPARFALNLARRVLNFKFTAFALCLLQDLCRSPNLYPRSKSRVEIKFYLARKIAARKISSLVFLKVCVHSVCDALGDAILIGAFA